mgnify:CR=1 FL=1
MKATQKQTRAKLAETAARNSVAHARLKVSKYSKKVWRPVSSKKLFEEKNRNGSMRYRVLIGYDKNGKQIKVSFSDKKKDAIAFQTEWNKSQENNDGTIQTILEDVAAIDVRWALAELQKVNSNLREAVEFYLKYAVPDGGFLNWEEAIEKYYSIQLEKNLSKKSSDKKDKNFRTYAAPLKKHFGTKLITETLPEDIREYVDRYGKNWSERTYNDHLNFGRRVWNVLANSNYCHTELNPFESIPRKRRKSKRLHKKIMPWHGVKSFFRYAEAKAKKNPEVYQEIAFMALTFFCGVRVEEAHKLEWKQLRKNITKFTDPDKSNWSITVYGDQEKNAITKVNPIPTNAKYWLQDAYENRLKFRKLICADNVAQRMQRLKAGFKKHMLEEFKWKIDVPQNTQRHCFASYHLGKYSNYPLTVARMKHGNVDTLKQNYEAGVNPQDAAKFFQILPAKVFERQQEIQRVKDIAVLDDAGISEHNEKYYQAYMKECRKYFKEMLLRHDVPTIEAEDRSLDGQQVYVHGVFYQLDSNDLHQMFIQNVENKGFYGDEHFKGQKIKVLKEHLKFLENGHFFEIQDVPI